MGQGTESCGGYEIDYDPYYEELRSTSEPMWNCKDDSRIRLSAMTVNHIKGAIGVCKRASGTATFSCDSDTWDEWIDLFNNELEARSKINPRKESGAISQNLKSKFAPRGTKQDMKCHCGKEYSARIADLKRGWAKSCSKSCAATRREYGKPSATKIN